MNSFFLGHPFSKLQMGDKNAILSKHGLEDSKDFVSILPGSRRSDFSINADLHSICKKTS